MLISSLANSSNTSHEGQIKEIVFFSKNWESYSNGDGAVAGFYMDPPLPKACGTGDSRVLIDVEHPLYDSVVSAALAAKMSRTKVKLNYLSTCSIRYNSWDFGHLFLK